MILDVKALQDDARNVSLDELLTRLEVNVSHVGQGGQDQAITILHQMDIAQAKIDALAEKSQNARAEAARLDYLAAQLDQNARLFLGQLGGRTHLEALRRSARPDPRQKWWFVDERYKSQLRRRIRNILATITVLILISLILVILYEAFLKPDPRISAVYRYRSNAEEAMNLHDFTKALDQINAALALSPRDANLLLLRAVSEMKLGRPDQAAEDFSFAESIVGDHQVFLLARAEAWLKAGDAAAALADAREVVRIDPTSAEGFYYAGKADELLQNYSEAIKGYQTASELADRQGKTELNAVIRINLAMLMQSVPIGTPKPASK